MMHLLRRVHVVRLSVLLLRDVSIATKRSENEKYYEKNVEFDPSTKTYPAIKSMKHISVDLCASTIVPYRVVVRFICCHLGRKLYLDTTLYYACYLNLCAKAAIPIGTENRVEVRCIALIGRDCI